MLKMNGENNDKKREITRIEIVGMILVILSMVLLFFNAKVLGDLFNAMFNRAFKTVVPVYVTGSIGCAIIISVTLGRVLERLGFTDALMRIFVPLMKLIGVNACVAIPVVYNILGDINAAGRISSPIFKKAGATKDEQKIGIATLMQAPCSFSILIFGIIAMTAVNVRVFLVLVTSYFLPILLIPLLLKLTIWRDCKAVSLDEIPVFTPKTEFLPTIFGAAKEGAELLFILIIPACSIIFAIIGALEFFGVWQPFESTLNSILAAMNIEPSSGVVSMLAGGSLALAQLKDVATNFSPQWVVGSFVLASSGWPLQVIFGQIPVIWTASTDLNHRECIVAASVGAIIRLLTAALFGSVLGFLYVK
jgi:hypothetical protein